MGRLSREIGIYSRDLCISLSDSDGEKEPEAWARASTPVLKIFQRHSKTAFGTVKLPSLVKRNILGVLALQGDFAAHARVLESLGQDVRLVRVPSDLEGLDGLVIPGGESTVMSRLCERYGLLEPLRQRVQGGLPAFGTCAGLIFLAKRLEGEAQTFEQSTLDALDCTVARNAYGAQRESFQTPIEVPALEGSVEATFIRAPRVVRSGAGVEVLARFENSPVIVRQGRILGCAFHPELAGETRLHGLWIAGLESGRGGKK